MNNKFISILFIVSILFSCSTGKKAFQKGNYYDAVNKAVDRLKSSPDNRKAINVLRESYPVALDWSQEQLDLALTSMVAFKWENAIWIMNEVNRLSENIRSTPAARKIINSPKNYSVELNLAFEKAAEERYTSGENELSKNTRESARMAYNHFLRANELVSGFKNVNQKLAEAKRLATAIVILEAIPVFSSKYQLTSEFFYNQIFEFLNNRYSGNSFIEVFSPEQARNSGLNYSDVIISIEFFDFSVGNTDHFEKEETVEKKVKIETKDTTKTEYKTYKAKIKNFTNKVISGGNLRLKITENKENRLIINELLSDSFT